MGKIMTIKEVIVKALHENFAEFTDDKADAIIQKLNEAGFVLVPKLSANYLFNQVPELGFSHKDEKETVLYHLNYMASEFKEDAKRFVENDHAKQAEFAVQEEGNDNIE